MSNYFGGELREVGITKTFFIEGSNGGGAIGGDGGERLEEGR